VNVRANLGLEDQARSLTQWQAYGKKQVPPHYWLEYLKCLDQRRTDLLEILHASALRDAESHDSNFASFYWNISQNASKEKHRSATPGIAGCITPGKSIPSLHKISRDCILRFDCLFCAIYRRQEATLSFQVMAVHCLAARS
jgi:hypothetical protein